MVAYTKPPKILEIDRLSGEEHQIKFFYFRFESRQVVALDDHLRDRVPKLSCEI